jgi:hypothetical protein
VGHIVVVSSAHRSYRRIGRFAPAIALAISISSCGGDSPPTPTATIAIDLTATVAAAVTPTPVPTPEIGEIVWASSIDPETRAPRNSVDRESVDDRTLYAVLPVRNLPAGVALTAAWSYNDTPLDELTTTTVVPAGPIAGWVEFHLTRSEEPWPDGTYAISVRFDGKVVQTAKVIVADE